jgi:hypothetical protein
MTRPTGKVTYWTEMSQTLYKERLFMIPILSECGITVVDDSGPVGPDGTVYLKVRDEEAPDELEGRTVDLEFQAYTEPHYEEGHDPLVKHRILTKEVRKCV